MISTQRYFIHIDNKSIVPWTSEIEGNYKFKEITLRIALAVERGRISADEVVAQIVRQMQAKPATLEQMLDAKLKMNVREGELNLEAQVKADNSQKDTGEAKPYAVDIHGEGGKMPVEPVEKPGKLQKAAKKNNEAPSDAAEKGATALVDAGRGTVTGTVNV